MADENIFDKIDDLNDDLKKTPLRPYQNLKELVDDVVRYDGVVDDGKYGRALDTVSTLDMTQELYDYGIDLSGDVVALDVSDKQKKMIETSMTRHVRFTQELLSTENTIRMASAMRRLKALNLPVEQRETFLKLLKDTYGSSKNE